MQGQVALWNPTNKLLEGKYDGIYYHFAPNEKKLFNSPLNNVLINHLLIKLSDYGLVMISESVLEMDVESGKKELEKIKANSLESRRRTLDRVVRAFRTMNKEREASKLSAEQPTDHVIACVEEIEQIQKDLATLKKDGIEKVNRYLNANKDVEAEEKLMDSEAEVARDGKIARRGRPRKEAAQAQEA